MKRYQLIDCDGGDPFAEENSIGGMWVRYEDAQEEIERLRDLIKSMGTGYDDAAIDAAMGDTYEQ